MCTALHSIDQLFDLINVAYAVDCGTDPDLELAYGLYLYDRKRGKRMLDRPALPAHDRPLPRVSEYDSTLGRRIWRRLGE